MTVDAAREGLSRVLHSALEERPFQHVLCKSGLCGIQTEDAMEGFVHSERSQGGIQLAVP